MKKMKNIFLKIAMVSIILVGCSESFLELTPHQSVTTQKALENLDDFKAAITGVYNRMSGAAYYGRYFVLVPDVMSDDVKQNASANRAKEYAEFTVNSEYGIP